VEACADGDTIHTLDISGPVHRKSSPERTNSSRRDRTRVNSVQMQRERRSVRAGSSTSGLRQQPAGYLITPPSPAEEVVTFQKPNAQSATSPAAESALLRRVHSSRVSKARVRTRTQVSPEAAHRDDAGQPSRKGKQKEKPATTRGGKDIVKCQRKKQHLTDAPVRRSARLLGKPEICYPR
jgi:hypothetical protein